jgi:hypothetical protein
MNDEKLKTSIIKLGSAIGTSLGELRNVTLGAIADILLDRGCLKCVENSIFDFDKLDADLTNLSEGIASSDGVEVLGSIVIISATPVQQTTIELYYRREEQVVKRTLTFAWNDIKNAPQDLIASLKTAGEVRLKHSVVRDDSRSDEG